MSTDWIIYAYAAGITVLCIILSGSVTSYVAQIKHLHDDLDAANEREAEARRAMNAANRNARWHG